jgi:hercynine metabolism protein
MSGSSNWLEELEARLDRQLESFLKSNPQQETLLAEQQARERQQDLRRQRLDLKQEAELQRQGLLRLASEIRAWQERVLRARSAGADALADRAEAHINELMEQGRCRWETLAEVGQRFSAVDLELRHMAAPTAGGPDQGSTSPPGDGRTPSQAQPKSNPQADLESDWTAFENQQDLQELRRKMQR